jgi:hypothetical protein
MAAPNQLSRTGSVEDVCWFMTKATWLCRQTHDVIPDSVGSLFAETKKCIFMITKRSLISM